MLTKSETIKDQLDFIFQYIKHLKPNLTSESHSYEHLGDSLVELFTFDVKKKNHLIHHYGDKIKRTGSADVYVIKDVDKDYNFAFQQELIIFCLTHLREFLLNNTLKHKDDRIKVIGIRVLETIFNFLVHQQSNKNTPKYSFIYESIKSFCLVELFDQTEQANADYHEDGDKILHWNNSQETITIYPIMDILIGTVMNISIEGMNGTNLSIQFKAKCINVLSLILQSEEFRDLLNEFPFESIIALNFLSSHQQIVQANCDLFLSLYQLLDTKTSSKSNENDLSWLETILPYQVLIQESVVIELTWACINKTRQDNKATWFCRSILDNEYILLKERLVSILCHSHKLYQSQAFECIVSCLQENIEFPFHLFLNSCSIYLAKKHSCGLKEDIQDVNKKKYTINHNSDSSASQVDENGNEGNQIRKKMKMSFATVLDHKSLEEKIITYAGFLLCCSCSNTACSSLTIKEQKKSILVYELINCQGTFSFLMNYKLNDRISFVVQTMMLFMKSCKLEDFELIQRCILFCLDHLKSLMMKSKNEESEKILNHLSNVANDNDAGQISNDKQQANVFFINILLIRMIKELVCQMTDDGSTDDSLFESSVELPIKRNISLHQKGWIDMSLFELHEKRMKHDKNSRIKLRENFHANDDEYSGFGLSCCELNCYDC